MVRTIVSCLVFVMAFTAINAQPVSELVAKTAMNKWKDSTMPAKWSYDQGVVWEGLEGIWRRTANPDYYAYIEKAVDHYVTSDGEIRTYKLEDQNIDNIKNGRTLLTLYKVSGKLKYLKAAQTLRKQLMSQPRTSDGGFWHKNIYPSQMWLDGLYMGEPFYAEYSAMMKDDTAFNDIEKQFRLMEQHARDAKTGLLYHGWDDSKAQQWANKTTGVSPNFWGRAMGWYGMALVDVLDYFPPNHPKRKTLVDILVRFAEAVKKVQDPATGLWYQVLDKPKEAGNYLESSASAMFVYALAKGVRQGVLPASYFTVAKNGYNGMLSRFIEKDAQGMSNYTKTVAVAGLGGNPYRDGTYAYYISEKVVTNDPKGVGAFLQASNEMEIAAMPKVGKGKTVTLDSYFNNETIKTGTGLTEPFHYRWEERDNNGISFLGEVFTNIGASINTLETAPDAASLAKSDIYIIIDPDTKKETPDPNYVEEVHVKAISKWVQDGGVLVLMGNDSGNMEFPHFNKLAEAFGIHFIETSKNRVEGNKFEMGAFVTNSGNPIFTEGLKLYMKEVSPLQVKAPAKTVFEAKGFNVIAVAKVGKGTVFAVGDPWLYNEYTDGRKLGHEFKNYEAAKQLVNWLIKQSPSGKKAK